MPVVDFCRERLIEACIRVGAVSQELKNLRPQLYSAAEYCEKSYLNSEQKQMYDLIVAPLLRLLGLVAAIEAFLRWSSWNLSVYG